jgi:hypothetical protein
LCLAANQVVSTNPNDGYADLLEGTKALCVGRHGTYGEPGDATKALDKVLEVRRGAMEPAIRGAR